MFILHFPSCVTHVSVSAASQMAALATQGFFAWPVNALQPGTAALAVVAAGSGQAASIILSTPAAVLMEPLTSRPL